jgi:hypothetical protein
MQRLFAAVLVVACVVGSTRLLADTALILALAIPAVPTRRAFRAQVCQQARECHYFTDHLEPLRRRSAFIGDAVQTSSPN